MGGMSRSQALRQRALKVIPLGTQTHSKAPREALAQVEPSFLARGAGGRVWDVDGHEFIDLRCSLGPITLGHGHPAPLAAVRDQLERGTLFSYPCELEVEVAERLVELIPCAEQVRFLRTGGEAMAACFRLARAATGRDRILTCGYHGWLQTVSTPGNPESWRALNQAMPWGDLSAYERVLDENGDDVAALSVAYAYHAGDAAAGFLRGLRALADAAGALLIFDEIVTGFRIAVGGCQERWSVVPDLAVFSKGMANGWPIAAYLGRRDLMQQVAEVIISSTFGGEATGLAACRAVLDVYRTEDVIGHLAVRGRQLVDGLNGCFAAHDAPAALVGLPACPLLRWREPALALRFEEEMLRRGVILYTVCYVNYAHTAADIDDVLARADEALAAMGADGCFDRR